MKKLFNKKESNQKGFTLLFAILVSILILAVGASIISIALKQVILSGAGRESQYAFYAANTGLECALYWDLNGTTLNDGEAKYIFPPPNTEGARRTDLDDVTCAGTNISSGSSEFSQSYTSPWITETNKTVFRIAISNTINSSLDDILYCTEVTVEKSEVGDEVYTTITSQGLNTCDPENDTRAVQRGLVLQYRS